MAKPCVWCKIKPKRLNEHGHPKDGFCSAKCKKAARWEDIKLEDRSRVCDPDHGWF